MAESEIKSFTNVLTFFFRLWSHIMGYVIMISEQTAPYSYQKKSAMQMNYTKSKKWSIIPLRVEKHVFLHNRQVFYMTFYLYQLFILKVVTNYQYSADLQPLCLKPTSGFEDKISHF